jgi:hypothetical protein
MPKTETTINSLEELNESHTSLEVRSLWHQAGCFKRAIERFENKPSEDALKYLMNAARNYQEAWINVKAN